MIKKAQISVEFLIIIGVALIMFMFLFKIAADKSQQFAVQSSQLYAKQLTDKVAQNVNSIYLAGNGASKTIILPETMMNNLDYSINFYPDYNLVEINYSNGKYASFLFVPEIQTNLTNINYPITIENNNGVVLIS